MSSRLKELLEERLGPDFMGQDRQTSSNKVHPEVAIKLMREAASRAVQKCPFKVNDLITPTAAANVIGRGDPYMVIEVLDEPIRLGDDEPTYSHNFNRKLDIRIIGVRIGVDGPTVVPFWAESWEYQPYVADPATSGLN